MTEPVDQGPKPLPQDTVGARRSYRLDGKLGGLRYSFGATILDLKSLTRAAGHEIAAPSGVALPAPASGDPLLQAIRRWEWEGGATGR